MEESATWKSKISAVDRCSNLQKIKKALKIARGLSSNDLQTSAIQIEKDAFNTSETRDAYEAACHAFNDDQSEYDRFKLAPESNSPGISIGEYENCHQISSGFCSNVFRNKTMALKVIRRTHDIEPHNIGLEIKILSTLSHPSIIKLIKHFYDSDKRSVLVFPYQPLTLLNLVSSHSIPKSLVASLFEDIFSGLKYLHEREIIHRDIKPSNILIASSSGPAILADFGTAWHPVFSEMFEKSNHKHLEVGTTAYRAPETLFGHRTYGTSLDIWACGVLLAECLRVPPKPLFQSREAYEDGNQLGLILSMFQTLGTPTRQTWPEACAFSTPPFEWYKEFPVQDWKVILEGVEDRGIDLVSKLVIWESSLRLTAAEVSLLYSTPRQKLFSHIPTTISRP